MSTLPSELQAWTWAFEQASEAMECLAHRTGLPIRLHSAEPKRASAEIQRSQQLRSAWLVELGRHHGIEISAVYEQHARLAELVRGCAPALLSIESASERAGAPRLLAIVSATRKHARVIDPAGRTHDITLETVRRAITYALEAPIADELSDLLRSAQIPAERHARARAALLRERLEHVSIDAGWLLRASSTAPVRQTLATRALRRPLIAMLLLYFAQYAMLGVAWDAARRGALLGQLDRAWLWAWLLATFSALPLTAAASWLSARFALEAGSWLRTRLLEGILRLDADQLRGQGAGHLLGRVMEAGALETLGLGGAILACFASVDFAVAALLLSRGVCAAALLVVLALALAAALITARSYYRSRLRWTTSRLGLTHDLIDRMLGHRTRAMQEPRSQWHEAEDRALENYLTDSKTLDRRAIGVSVLSRCFLLSGFACLAFSLVLASPSPIDLALAMAGLLVAARALASISSALAHLSSAAIAWREVSSLMSAPALEPAADPALACAARTRFARASLEARELTLQHAGRSEPLLSAVDLTIQAGERVLLEGPSGSGKTTLAHVLAGLRRAQRGLLLFNGLDRHTLGWSGWNRRVTVAPQYHDNHVLSGSFAFNVLLGRTWPPTSEDLAHAARVCEQIGLGPLLSRMPAGMQQIVGETGWQLSHGERGRLFAARAILADADLVVLDESVAALDPETAAAVVRCAREHTRSLMLIAHP
jgi:ATP-binding cassette subfamily B protein